jgi:tight adherence protein B
MNYLTLLVILASLSVFFTLQALYWIAKSRRDKRSAMLDQRLGAHEDEDSGYEDLVRDEIEGDWALRLSQLIRAAGEDGDVSAFFQKAMIYACITFLAGLLLSKSPVIGLLFALAGGYLPYAQLKGKRDQRIDQIEQQLPEALEMMIISLRAGQSLEQTVALNARELPAPIGEEFAQISEEVRLGISMDEAMKSMSSRLPNARTVRGFVVSVLVLRQTGGNLIEVLESIIDTMRLQARYEHKLKSMTAESRSNARTLGALPPVFVVISMLVNPGYVTQVGGSPLGRLMIMIGLALYLLGFIWINRLVNPSK